MQIKYRIELLSDTLLSSGDSESSVVDSDSMYDSFGIPWFPAKRLKGLMREAAEEQVACHLLTQEDVKLILGDEHRQGNLRLGNAYLSGYGHIQNEFLEMAKTQNISHSQLRENIISYFTNVRALISIDDFGIANDASLRFIRVLNKEHVQCFEGMMTFDDALKDKVENLLKAVKRVGLNRNRGFGRVKVLFTDKNKSSDFRVEEAFGDDLFELTYKVHALEPLVLSSQDGSYRSCEDYITGTQIRGIVAKYFNVGSKLMYDKDLLYLPETHFGHVYPVEQSGKIYTPTPLCFRKEKYGDKALVDLRHFQGLSKTMKPWFDGKEDYGVEMALNYHHRRPLDRSVASPGESNDSEDNGVLYTLPHVLAGQNFYGIIEGRKAFVEQVKNLFEAKIFFGVGKSTNAQYGSIKIDVIDMRAKSNQHIELKESFDLYCHSPLMIMNDMGSVGPYTDYMKMTLEEKFWGLEMYDSFLASKEVAGFNTMWGASTSKVITIDKGSVFRFRVNKEASYSISDITSFIKNFIGTRSIEGYNDLRLLQDLEEYRLDTIHLDTNTFESSNRYSEMFNEIKSKLKLKDLETQIKSDAKKACEDIEEWINLVRELYDNFLELKKPADEIMLDFVGHIKESTESQKKKKKDLTSLAMYFKKYNNRDILQSQKLFFDYLFLQSKGGKHEQ